MSYTFVPKERFAKASTKNTRISTKSAVKLCKLIRRKKLTQAKRLLSDLSNENRSIGGKYYTATAREMLLILESCEKNAIFKNLDTGKLFVHASAHLGNNMKRRRRKGNFGSKMKATNMEVMLIERNADIGKKKESKEETKKEAKK